MARPLGARTEAGHGSDEAAIIATERRSVWPEGRVERRGFKGLFADARCSSWKFPRERLRASR